MTSGTQSSVADDNDEYEEDDVEDRDQYSDQLTSMGIVSREILEHSLPTLSR